MNECLCSTMTIIGFGWGYMAVFSSRASEPYPFFPSETHSRSKGPSQASLHTLSPPIIHTPSRTPPPPYRRFRVPLIPAPPSLPSAHITASSPTYSIPLSITGRSSERHERWRFWTLPVGWGGFTFLVERKCGNRGWSLEDVLAIFWLRFGHALSMLWLRSSYTLVTQYLRPRYAQSKLSPSCEAYSIYFEYSGPRQQRARRSTALLIAPFKNPYTPL